MILRKRNSTSKSQDVGFLAELAEVCKCRLPCRTWCTCTPGDILLWLRDGIRIGKPKNRPAAEAEVGLASSADEIFASGT